MVIVATMLRLFVGCGLAAALGASRQLPTPFAAFLAGLAAPLIIARLFQGIAVVDSPVVDSPVVTEPPVPAARRGDADTAAGVENAHH